MTIRHLIFILLVLLTSIKSATGGDFATRNILGFSPDGRFFAFEQYGIQDGSGFPYADLIILDTRRNRWVKGVPFRTLLFDETATTQQARSQSKNKAAPLLKQMNIMPRGITLVSNPVTELGNSHRTIFRTTPASSRRLKPYRLDLKTIGLSEKKCTITDRKTRGISLKLKKLDTRSKAVFLARENRTTRLRRLRGCTIDYKIADVVLFDPSGSRKIQKENAALVVLLHVVQHGLEGKDGRYLALSHTGTLN